MKTWLLLVALAALAAGPVSAQQTLKLGFVDLGKCFTNYYKTKLADAGLKDEGTTLEKERKEMVDRLQKMSESYKKLLDGANDQAVTADERDRRKKSAEEELVKLRGAQAEIEQFERQAGSMLGEKRRRLRDNILVEIRDIVRTKAKAGGYTMVIDVAAESINNTPVLLYSTGDNDLTDSIVNELNAKAPASVKAGETPAAK